MTIESILIMLLIGAIAGWLAGMVVKGMGFGLIGNIIVGVIGSFIGGWLFAQFGVGIGGGIIGSIIASTVGAIVLLLVIKVIKKA